MSDVRDIPSADALAAMSSRERGRHEARVRVAARRQGLEMVKRWMPESMRPRYVLVDPATRAQVSDVFRELTDAERALVDCDAMGRTVWS